MIAPSGRLRTLQLCVHCKESPAGFWVSHRGGKVVRTPWCLACCQELDRVHCHVTPFGNSLPSRPHFQAGGLRRGSAGRPVLVVNTRAGCAVRA